MQSGIMLRRLKNEVIKDLPRKIRSKLFIEVDDNITKKIK